VLFSSPHPVLRCPDCGHLFCTTRPDESVYNEDYVGFAPDPIFQARLRRELRVSFAARIRPPARILDVGCGNGDFLFAAMEMGYATLGIDVSAAAVARVRRRGLDAIQGSLAAAPLERAFEFVTAWDVIEHVNDPRTFVRRSRDLLTPGGYLVLKTPDVRRATIGLAMAAPRWRRGLLQLPAHLQLFNKASLARLLEDAGFSDARVARIGPMRSLGHAPGKAFRRHAKSMLKRATASGNLYVFAQAPR
jgi:2-polyprenyl-3-methyl-5-hydroxy-6-metoxy-1,4-benzoquinol methylase